MPDAISLSAVSRTQAVALRYAGALVESRTSASGPDNGDSVARERTGTTPEKRREDTLALIQARRAVHAQREAERTRYDAQPGAHKMERRQDIAPGKESAGRMASPGEGPATPAATAAGGSPTASGGESAGASTGSSGTGSGDSSSGSGGSHGFGRGSGGHSFGFGNFLTVGFGGRSSLLSLRV